MKATEKILLMAFVTILALAPNASAVTIITSFIGGTPPANAAGGGNLIDIVNSAARMWESAYSDSSTVLLYVGWAPLENAGTHSLIEQGGVPNRETVGVILFDNSGSVSFFMDPTPNSSEEYGRISEEYQDLGAGLVNVARVFKSPRGDAFGRIDLLSVALHEMGHALGMGYNNITFAAQSGTGTIRITEDLPLAGTVIPLTSNNSGIIPHFDSNQLAYGSVMSGICGDERRLLSSLDILADAQVSGFHIQKLNLPDAPSF